MEYLIKKGVPMRSGHEIVGKLVSDCEKQGLRLKDLPIAEIRKVCDKVDESVFDILGGANACDALISYGAAGRQRVKEQLRLWQQRLGE
jgi:argininosuccinate lyase